MMTEAERLELEAMLVKAKARKIWEAGFINSLRRMMEDPAWEPTAHQYQYLARLARRRK
jgi:hypothetical protein